jgi:hypothetical protein
VLAWRDAPRTPAGLAAPFLRHGAAALLARSAHGIPGLAAVFFSHGSLHVA